MMSERKINGISLLRVIAVCMILVVHFGQSLPFPEVLHTTIVWCQHGVQLFFLISGFLIFKSLDKNSDIKVFYRKRLLRIIPAYWTIIVLNILLFGILLKTMSVDEFHIGWLRYFFFLQTLILTSNVDAWNNLSALWTMSSFGIFYLLAPFFHKVMNTYKRAYAIVLVAIGTGTIFTQVLCQLAEKSRYTESLNYLSGKSPVAVLYVFLIGGLIYLYTEDRQKMSGGVFPSYRCGLVSNIRLLWSDDCCDLGSNPRAYTIKDFYI